MTTETATDTELLSTFIDNQLSIVDGVEINKWQMYEFIKGQLHRFDVSYEDGIKMITDKMEL